MFDFLKRRSQPRIEPEDVILLLHRELSNMQDRRVCGTITRSGDDMVRVQGEIDLKQIAKAMVRMIEEGPLQEPPFQKRRA